MQQYTHPMGQLFGKGLLAWLFSGGSGFVMQIYNDSNSHKNMI